MGDERTEVEVTGELRRDADSTWHFLPIPPAVRAAWAAHAHRGHIRVTATLGGSTWDGSLMPWADGGAQLSVGAAVRRREGVGEGDVVRVVLRVRD